jgi:hypothetical protein
MKGLLTWIWGASCVSRVAFHAAPLNRGQRWGLWGDNGRSSCRRSSTRSPGAGDVPAAFCDTHKHKHFIAALSTKLQAQSDTKQTNHSYIHTSFRTCKVLLQGSTDRIRLPHLMHSSWVFDPKTW